MKLAIWALVILVALQSGYFGGLGGVPTDEKGEIKLPSLKEDATITLKAVDEYKTGTSRSTTYTRVYVKDDGQWFDQGLVSNDAGTFETDVNTEVKMFAAENSSTYYTVKRVETIPDKGQPKYQFALRTIDTSMTRTFYNDDGDSNTAQAIGSGDTKTVTIKYTATANKGFGNPQCESEGGRKPVTICFGANSSAYSSITLKGQSPIAAPKEIMDLANATNSINCYGGAAVADGGDGQRYSVEITTIADVATAGGQDNIRIYYSDCDFDVNAQNSAEIWSTEDEDGNNLGSTYQIDHITVS